MGLVKEGLDPSIFHMKLSCFDFEAQRNANSGPLALPFLSRHWLRLLGLLIDRKFNFRFLLSRLCLLDRSLCLSCCNLLCLALICCEGLLILRGLS